MNPGPATSHLAKYEPLRSIFDTIASAIFLGLFLKGLAHTIAALVETSPFFESAGISVLNAGTGSAGNVPSATSSPIAFITSSLA